MPFRKIPIGRAGGELVPKDGCCTSDLNLDAKGSEEKNSRWNPIASGGGGGIEPFPIGRNPCPRSKATLETFFSPDAQQLLQHKSPETILLETLNQHPNPDPLLEKIWPKAIWSQLHPHLNTLCQIYRWNANRHLESMALLRYPKTVLLSSLDDKLKAISLKLRLFKHDFTTPWNLVKR